jgi:ArsR family transcriptional regulator
MRDAMESLARRLQAVSVGTRIRILCLLKRRALCVGAIVARLNITQGAVSQHLRVLREAGFVEADRRGCHVHYRLRPEALAECKQALDRILRCGPEEPFSQKGVDPCARTRRDVRNRRS